MLKIKSLTFCYNSAFPEQHWRNPGTPHSPPAPARGPGGSKSPVLSLCPHQGTRTYTQVEGRRPSSEDEQERTGLSATGHLPGAAGQQAGAAVQWEPSASPAAALQMAARPGPSPPGPAALPSPEGLGLPHIFPRAATAADRARSSAFRQSPGCLGLRLRTSRGRRALPWLLSLESGEGAAVV